MISNQKKHSKHPPRRWIRKMDVEDAILDYRGHRKPQAEAQMKHEKQKQK